MIENFYNYFFQIFFAILVIFLYFYHLKPKMRYVFYGFFFFFVALLMQPPLKYFLTMLDRILDFVDLPVFVFSGLSIIIVEVTKYFSLKKFIKTKNFHNALFFGIGWISLASINFFVIYFFDSIFGLLDIYFDYSYLLNPEYGVIFFIYYYILNLAVSVYVVLAIVLKDLIYLFNGVSFSLIANIGLLYMSGFMNYLFMAGIFVFSIYIIFDNKVHYHKYFRKAKKFIHRTN
jgi:hypothetical protein